MPSSLLALAPRVIAMVQDTVDTFDRPVRILDVGPGHGKYGVLCREYLRRDQVLALDAIEAEPRYVLAHPWLECIYDRVHVRDVLTMNVAQLAVYDVILMCDVIEHFDSDDALLLLERIIGFVIISTPRDFFQNEAEVAAGYETERHRSHWRAVDFGARVDREDWLAHEQYAAVLVRLAAR